MLLDLPTLYAFFGFIFAAYAVISNDAVQTLGTFIASNARIMPWYWLWMAASLVLIATLGIQWWGSGGDISFGRLEKITPQTIQWYHALMPLVLVVLTRYGIPVSTTFLVLSAFASSFVMEKMLLKSVMGYATAAIFAYIFWIILTQKLNEKYGKVKKEHRLIWRILQWCSTGFLWMTWLMHDMANIAVFLPRQLSFPALVGVLSVLVVFLALIFKQQGGKINEIVLEKSGARFTRSATIIDCCFAFILIIFKEMNSIPMSTTWVFVGLLGGRELAIATAYRKKYRFGKVFPLLGRDFFKMMLGLLVSLAFVMLIHYGLKPGE